MANSTPIVSNVTAATAAVIRAADGDVGPRVYETFRNARNNQEFTDIFIKPTVNTIHAWMVDYGGIIERREDDAGDLFWIRHLFEIHFYYGPFNDGDETKLFFADVLDEVASAIEGDRTIFEVPDITERTIGIANQEEVEFGAFLMHHGFFGMEVTATQFKAVPA